LAVGGGCGESAVTGPGGGRFNRLFGWFLAVIAMLVMIEIALGLFVALAPWLIGLLTATATGAIPQLLTASPRPPKSRTADPGAGTAVCAYELWWR